MVKSTEAAANASGLPIERIVAAGDNILLRDVKRHTPPAIAAAVGFTDIDDLMDMLMTASVSRSAPEFKVEGHMAKKLFRATKEAIAAIAKKMSREFLATPPKNTA